MTKDRLITYEREDRPNVRIIPDFNTVFFKGYSLVFYWVDGYVIKVPWLEFVSTRIT